VQKLSGEARVPTKGSTKAAGHHLYASKETNLPARGQAIVGTGIAIALPHNSYERIALRSSLVVKHQLMTNGGVIDSDYRGKVKMVLANLGDQAYRVEKEDRIAQLIIEKIDNRELQELRQLDDTERGDQGFGSSYTTMQQRVTGQKSKPHMEINKISARALGLFYRRGERTRILRWVVSGKCRSVVHGGPERSWSTKGGRGPRGPPGPLRSALIHTFRNFTKNVDQGGSEWTSRTRGTITPLGGPGVVFTFC